MSSRRPRPTPRSAPTRPSGGVHIICQKPLAPTYAESAAIVENARQAGVRFMVHENWRWQPWYREIKRLIENDELGEVYLGLLPHAHRRRLARRMPTWRANPSSGTIRAC